MPTRREQILREARRLFRERGFHAVGIDEIGEAAGISGPGVYRHFSSKDELLIRALEDATSRLWRDLPDDATVGDYVRAHVAFSLEDTDAIELWERERRHLPPDAERAQRRLQRRYVEGWVDALRREVPGLDEAEARARVHAVVSMLHSTTQLERVVEPKRLGPLLERMALAALSS